VSNLPVAGPPPMPPQQPLPQQTKKRSKVHWIAYPLVLIAGVGIGSTGGSGSDGSSPDASAPVATSASAGGGQDVGSGGQADQVATTAPRRTTAATKPSEPGIGDPVRDGKFEFTVTRVKRGVKSVGSDMFGQKAQGQFILVSVKVENIGKKSQTFSASGQKLYDQSGREFDADSTAAIYIESSNSLYTPINPGNAVRGVVVFDVPKNVVPTKLELHDSVFSGGTEVML
jgi:hypothetical protein